MDKAIKNIAIIVAHPDDETLWCGGTILSHPAWNCFIVCLCRKQDMDRSSKFYNVLKVLKSKGDMGNLNDDTNQNAVDEKEIENLILDLLPPRYYDLIITHNPSGEYTKHLRHEEVSKSVITLWHANKIYANELWTFAYDDNQKKHFPKATENAPVNFFLTKRIWLRKYKIITEIYEFGKDSWEAETTPKTESFWQFTKSFDAKKWLNCHGKLAQYI